MVSTRSGKVTQKKSKASKETKSAITKSSHVKAKTPVKKSPKKTRRKAREKPASPQSSDWQPSSSVSSSPSPPKPRKKQERKLPKPETILKAEKASQSPESEPHNPADKKEPAVRRDRNGNHGGTGKSVSLIKDMWENRYEVPFLPSMQKIPAARSSNASMVSVEEACIAIVCTNHDQRAKKQIRKKERSAA